MPYHGTASFLLTQVQGEPYRSGPTAKSLRELVGIARPAKLVFGKTLPSVEFPRGILAPARQIKSALRGQRGTAWRHRSRSRKPASPPPAVSTLGNASAWHGAPADATFRSRS